MNQKEKNVALQHEAWQRDKIKVKNAILCNKCKQDSGYTNDDFLYANVDRDIKCKNCGKVCIKLQCSKKDGVFVPHMPDRGVIAEKVVPKKEEE